MTSPARLLTVLAAALAGALSAPPAQAQSRVFVGAQGADGNPCTFALPCRTFQRAHTVVAAGGEIDVLDPAGYGPLTISKPISIQGHGFAGISVTGGNTGITINAVDLDAIHLDGLLIEGDGAGAVGIRFNTGRSLVVRKCVIRNMIGDAIRFIGNASSSTFETLTVSDSTIAGNGGAAIHIEPISTVPVKAGIERVVFSGNGNGLQAVGNNGSANLDVAVSDSSASSSSGIGFIVQSSAGHSVSSLALIRTTVSGNQFGVEASGANATLLLSQTTITGNTIGFSVAAGGVISSYGDNNIDDNGANTGALSAASKQ
jgi:hypothetical protein